MVEFATARMLLAVGITNYNHERTMNTDTPRTDIIIQQTSGFGTASAIQRLVEFSRQLERAYNEVTEQRDELLRYNEAFRKESLICADCDAIRKEEYDQAIEQRDRLRVIAGELIAMIRMNIMLGKFEKCTIEQIDEHIKPWIDNIAALKDNNQ